MEIKADEIETEAEDAGEPKRSNFFPLDDKRKCVRSRWQLRFRAGVFFVFARIESSSSRQLRNPVPNGTHSQRADSEGRTERVPLRRTCSWASADSPGCRA